MKPLRLMIYDRTCSGRLALPGLSHAWGAGSLLYRGLGRLDGTRGVTSWSEALSWLVAFEPERPIAEIQYWGHGKWGGALVDRDMLDARALAPGHRHAPHLDALRARLAPDPLVWFRTCETVGASAGQDFAMRLSDRLGARVAGHTFVIHALQSGLHGVRPGCRPDWALEEGIAEGTPDQPRRAFASTLQSPNTITCFAGKVPPAWFVTS